MEYIDYKLFKKINGITNLNIADFLGVSEAYVSMVTSGKTKFSEERFAMLLDHPEWDTSPLLGRAQEEKPAYHNPLNLPPTAKPLSVPTLAPVEDGEVIEAEVVELPIVPTAVVRQPETRLSKWLDKYSDEVERLRLSEIISGATMVREVKDKDMCPALKMGQYIYLELMPREMPIKNGRIYFVDHKKVEGFFRRLYDRGDSIECRADKPAIEPNIYSKDDIYDIYKVVGVFSTDIIDDEDALAKDRQIALLTEQLNRLMAQQEQHTSNTAEALASTNRAIEQIDKMTSQQGKLIEALVEKNNNQ
ncbi:MAG: hypothetical protein J6U49_05395 [Alistipes sp.]|nr:hypothetical protein [Alistipes sp.]